MAGGAKGRDNDERGSAGGSGRFPAPVPAGHWDSDQALAAAALAESAAVSDLPYARRARARFNSVLCGRDWYLRILPEPDRGGFLRGIMERMAPSERSQIEQELPALDRLSMVMTTEGFWLLEKAGRLSSAWKLVWMSHPDGRIPTTIPPRPRSAKTFILSALAGPGCPDPKRNADLLRSWKALGPDGRTWVAAQLRDLLDECLSTFDRIDARMKAPGHAAATVPMGHVPVTLGTLGSSSPPPCNAGARGQPRDGSSGAPREDQK